MLCTAGPILWSNPCKKPCSNPGRQMWNYPSRFGHGIKSPIFPRHCRDDAEAKTWHLSPAMPPLSPAPWGLGLQMTGALPNFMVDLRLCRTINNILAMLSHCLLSFFMVLQVHSFSRNTPYQWQAELGLSHVWPEPAQAHSGEKPNHSEGLRQRSQSPGHHLWLVGLLQDETHARN